MILCRGEFKQSRFRSGIITLHQNSISAWSNDEALGKIENSNQIQSIAKRQSDYVDTVQNFV